MVDYLERRPFLGTEELPGPRGKNESVPSGHGQRAYEKVLVGREVGRELEGVRKKACVWVRCECGERQRWNCGDALIISVMVKEWGTTVGKGGLVRWEGDFWTPLIFDGRA